MATISNSFLLFLLIFLGFCIFIFVNNKNLIILIAANNKFFNTIMSNRIIFYIPHKFNIRLLDFVRLKIAIETKMVVLTDD